MSNDSRHSWIDGLRIAAGVSMVGLHATADVQGHPWTDATEAERVVPMLLRAVLYTARTELFILIAVFLLLASVERRPRGYLETLSEQARRLLGPFLFWTVFYAAYTLIKANAFGYLPQRIDQLTSPESWAGYLLLGDVKYHMHFIPTLFGVVLMYPLFLAAVRRPVLGAGILLCLAVRQEVDLWLWANFWDREWLDWALRVTKVVTYGGYGLAAGAMLGLWQRHRDALPQLLPIAVYAGALLFMIKLIATAKTIETGAWAFDYRPAYWADFLMPVFLFLIAMCLAKRSWSTWFARLAPFSFGLYLCHPIFLDLAEIALSETSLPPIAIIVSKLAFTLPATLALVLLIARTRALSWTIGLGALRQTGNSRLAGAIARPNGG